MAPSVALPPLVGVTVRAIRVPPLEYVTRYARFVTLYAARGATEPPSIKNAPPSVWPCASSRSPLTSAFHVFHTTRYCCCTESKAASKSATTDGSFTICAPAATGASPLGPAPAVANVAMQLRAAVTVTLPSPQSASPVQPVNVDDPAGVAMSVTTVPLV